MSKVVAELVALILERVKRFVFDLPTRTTASNQMACVVTSNRQIGDPTEAFANRTVRRILGVLQEVDQEIRVRFVQWQLVGESNLALHFFLLRVIGPTELIKRVYEVNSLACPQCGGEMKIVSFIDPPQREVVEKILQHCGLWKASPPRGPPDPIDLDHDLDSGFMDQPPDLTFVDMDTFLSTF